MSLDTAPATWLGGAVTALPYALLPPYFGFPILKGATVAPAAPPQNCGVPMVLGMPSAWPAGAVATAATVPCVQPLSPQSSAAGEFSPSSAGSDDTRSVPSAGSPKTSSDIDDLALISASTDGLEMRRAAQNRAEKERRNVLKGGFEELKTMVPECGKGFSKAKILHKAVDYVSDLVRDKTSLLQEAEKLRAEVQQLRGVLRQYEELEGITPSELADLETRTRSTDSVNIKFFVFCCVIDKLYETFCATVSLENADIFSTSLLQWFKGHCTAETFLKPLQALGSRFFTPESATLRRCKSTLTAGKDAVVMMLEASGRRGVPYAKDLGATIDYMGTLCSQEQPATA